MLYEPRFSKNKLHHYMYNDKRLKSFIRINIDISRTLLGFKMPGRGYLREDYSKWNFTHKLSGDTKQYKYKMSNQVLTKPKTLSRFLGLKSYI